MKTFKRSISLFMLMLFLVSLSFSQTKKGIKYVKKKKYQEAIQAFEKDVEHPLYASVAYLNLALLNSLEAQEQSLFLECYKDVNKAEQLFDELDNEGKKKLRSKKLGRVNKSVFRSQKKKIERGALEAAEKSGSMTQVNLFEQLFPKPLIPKYAISKTKKNIQKIALKAVGESGKVAELNAFLKENPKLYISQSSVNKIQRKFEASDFSELEKSSSLFALDTFLQNYPVLLTPQPKIDKVRNRIVQKYLNSSDDYEVLTSLYNNHRRFISQQNLQYEWDAFPVKLLNTFFRQYGLQNMKSFVKDHPEHWVSKDCWAEDFIEAYNDESPNSLLEFLADNPLTMLDEMATLGVLSKFKGIDNLSPKARKKWTNIELGENLFGQLNKRELESNFYKRMKTYLTESAPTPEAYRLMKKAVNYYIVEKKWGEAINLVTTSKSLFPDDQPSKCAQSYQYHSNKQKWFDTVLPILKAPASGITLTPINEINTDFGQEHSPILSADGGQLFFAGSYAAKSNAGEDIYTSKYDFEKKEWGKPELVPNLSGEGNQGPLSLTSNGDMMLVFVDKKLHLSELTSTGWSKPKPFSTEINQFDWIGKATLSHDGNVIIFEASNPVDGLMNTPDINLYVSIRQTNEKWGTPFPIGKNINSSGQDRSPFLHLDNETLYFSSNGDKHPKLGGMDIFVTRRLDNSWKNWSEPKNLGKEINTLNDDWGYNFSSKATGNLAYLASENFNNRKHDIYSTGLPEFARPKERTPVLIKLNRKDGLPLLTTLILENVETGEIIERIKTKPDGTGTFVPPAGITVRWYVEDDQIFPMSNIIDLKEHNSERVLEKPMEMISIKEMIQTGKPAPLNNLMFEHDKYELKDIAKKDIDKVNKLISTKKWTIEIAGHTDNEGTEVYNKNLSLKRAEAVRDYFIELGISLDRLSVKGMGSTVPISENDNELGRAKNRRVEIRFFNPS